MTWVLLPGWRGIPGTQRPGVAGSPGLAGGIVSRLQPVVRNYLLLSKYFSG